MALVCTVPELRDSAQVPSLTMMAVWLTLSWHDLGIIP